MSKKIFRNVMLQKHKEFLDWSKTSGWAYKLIAGMKEHQVDNETIMNTRRALNFD